MAYLNPAKTVLFGLSSATPYIHAWAWDNTTGIGTKYSDPATPPAGAPFIAPGIFFNDAGTRVMCSDTTPAVMSAYVWDDTTGFGSKFTSPSISSGSIRGIAFNQAKNIFVVNIQNSPRQLTLLWNDTTGFTQGSLAISSVTNLFTATFSPVEP